ncbi:Mycobacterium numidiamassiliense ORFan, partial [Mycobacterium numidiamassiliense]
VQSDFPALTEAQAKTVERAAVAAYCPQFTDLIAVNGPAADRQYLQELARFNIPVTDPARAIAAAHWVCDQLTSGTTQADVVREMLVQGFIRDTATGTVVAATGNYCPQFRGPLPTR